MMGAFFGVDFVYGPIVESVAQLTHSRQGTDHTKHAAQAGALRITTRVKLQAKGGRVGKDELVQYACQVGKLCPVGSSV